MRKIIYLIVSVLNLICAGIYLGTYEKDIIPLRYNYEGVAELYGSKWNLLLVAFIPLIITVIYFITEKIPDKKNSNKKYSEKIFMFCFLFVIFVFWFVANICMTNSSSVVLKNICFYMIILSAFFMFISNILPKLQKNSWIGIRIKATMSNDDIWRKTHRLGGKLGFIGGLIGFACGIIGFLFGDISSLMALISLCVIIVLGIIIPAIYANVIYIKTKNKI